MVSERDRQGPLYWYWSANQVVAYNLARAREAKGWSQEEASRRLEPHLGIAWSKATFSQAERSIDPGKSRAFSADEIVAFADTFGLPVTWFFLPPPPGTDGTPTRAETHQTPTEYATDVRRLLQRVVGTPEHHSEIQGRLETFAKEITARALAEAADVVAAGAARLHVDEPTPTEELSRWREALLAVADGLGAIEDAVARRIDVEVDERAEWPDLRTIELPQRGAAGAETRVAPRTSPEPEL
jgi:transcriptional regulator with XRE-family HTH domain